MDSGLQEAEAFRRIQKLSMNMRKSMREVAEAIRSRTRSGRRSERSHERSPSSCQGQCRKNVLSELIPVARTDEIAAGEMMLLDIDGDLVVLANVGGEYHAFQGTVRIGPHLAEGRWTAAASPARCTSGSSTFPPARPCSPA